MTPIRNGIGCAEVEVSDNHLKREGLAMKMTPIGIAICIDPGIDPGTNMFQLHRIDAQRKWISFCGSRYRKRYDLYHYRVVSF